MCNKTFSALPLPRHRWEATDAPQTQWRIQRYWLGRIEGTQRGLGGGMAPFNKLPPRKFLNLKVKMAHFCALLSIDFKVCRLITETVSDHIRSTVTNRLCLPPLFRASEARTRKYCDSGYKQSFFIHFITSLFCENWWKNQSCLTSLRGRSPLPPPGSATAQTL